MRAGDPAGEPSGVHIPSPLCTPLLPTGLLGPALSDPRLGTGWYLLDLKSKQKGTNAKDVCPYIPKRM